MTAMSVRPPFGYYSQAVAYISITPFVGVIGQQVTRVGLIREKGHQRWGEASPYREADRSKDLHQREPIEQGKELRFLTPEAERIGWLFVIALNTWLTGLDQYSHTYGSIPGSGTKVPFNISSAPGSSAR
jgi:hypothetical protein